MIDKGIAAGSTDMGGDHWRIAEFALLLLIFLGGSFGAWLGMIFCFHKIHKQSFICCAVPVTIFSLTWVFLWLILTAEDNLSKCYKYQKGIGDATRWSWQLDLLNEQLNSKTNELESCFKINGHILYSRSFIFDCKI